MLKSFLYNPDGLNVRLFAAINSHHNPLFDKIILGITNLGDSKMFVIYLTLLVITRMSLAKDNSKTIFSVFLLLAGFEFYVNVSPWLKEYFHYPRPYAAFPKLAIMPYRTPYIDDDYHSFPSGHAMFAMVMLCGFWPVLNKPAKALMLLVVLLVGYSRIVLAMHFPADVAAGYAIGLIGVLILLLARHIGCNLLRK